MRSSIMLDMSARLVAGLSRISMVLRHQAWEAAGPRGLTPTQAQVLTFLAAPGRSDMTPSRLAAELAVSAPTLSDAVAALARKRLLLSRPDPADRRVRRITLTATGRRLAAELSQWPDALIHAIDALNETERADFLRIVVKLIRSLQESGQIPVGRMCVSCRFFRPHVHADPAAPHHCDYVDAPFGDGALRIDCAEYEAADQQQSRRLWQVFVRGRPAQKV